jgi:hypothetical protein
MRILLPLLVVLFAGCQTKPVPARPAALPAAEPITTVHSRLTAEIGHYTLGAYVDADNDLIRHESHAIQRVEREPRWDLRPAPLPSRETREREIPATPVPEIPVVVVEPPVSAAEPEPPFVLPPTIPPTPQPAAIVTVVAPPPAPPPMPAPSPATAATLPVAAASEPALTPNAEGVLDLTAVTDGNEPSPFTVRSVGTEAMRELSLQLAGVIGGAFPCALVNGRPIQAGDMFESLFVVRVEPDGVLLRHEQQLIRLPVSAKPARLRIAL